MLGSSGSMSLCQAFPCMTEASQCSIQGSTFSILERVQLIAPRYCTRLTIFPSSRNFLLSIICSISLLRAAFSEAAQLW